MIPRVSSFSNFSFLGGDSDLLQLGCAGVHSHSRAVDVGHLGGGGPCTAVVEPGAWLGAGGGHSVDFLFVVLVHCTACSFQYISCNPLQGNPSSDCEGQASPQ